MNNHNTIAFLVFLLVLTLFTACEKDEGIPKNEYLYYYLTPEQIAQSPYFTKNKYDTLSFFNTKGDTFTFAKIKKDSSFNKISDNDVGTGKTIIHNYQYLHNTYQTLKGDGKFEVWHKANSVGSFIEVKLLNYKFEYEPRTIDKNSRPYTFYDRFDIQGQSFINVKRFNGVGGSLVFINVADGILTVISNQNTDSLIISKR